MIVYGAIMPHPPIVIPEVGGSQLAEAKVTVDGMKELAAEVQKSNPDTLVFITPHGNVFRDALSILTTRTSMGDLTAFGHPEVGAAHPADLELVRAVLNEATRSGVDIIGINRDLAEAHGLNADLDHGILVPLYYLERAGLADTQVVAISIGYLSRERLYTFGSLIAATAESLGRRVAVIASGDMSHRLKEEGAYSYHPDGQVFDNKVKELINNRDVTGLLQIPASLAENAGECGYRSIVILLGALEGWDFKTRVFSYEGPFGVGYLTAGFIPEAPNPNRKLLAQIRAARRREVEEKRRQESPVVRWARQSLEDYIRYGRKMDLPPDLPGELKENAGAFVSLKKDGQLRGCIGTITPQYDNLGLEIRENAISAGTRDYRFMPVTEDELEDIVYSVDVLKKPEPVKDIGDLDAQKYGIIVRCGDRVGVLLPALEGVETVEQQLDIALQKAGIGANEPYSIERFEVERFK